MNLHRSVVRGLLLTVLIALSEMSFAQVFVSVRVGPPALPIYAQPLCPGPGYLWTPGYWGWNDDGGYYWVPGTWVVAPVGMLWTPGYWGWGGGFYAWHPGYWGPHIGFYGGINYGFGYGGVGFVGGEWRGGAFYYNRSVTNVSVTSVTHVYNRTVVVNNTTTSYNGGTGGVEARPTAQEQAAEHEQHTPALAEQTQHEHLASQNRENFASENHGRPAVAATAKAGDFSSHSAVSARAAGGEYHAPEMSPKEARGPSTAGNRPFTPANSNNSNRTTGTSTPTPQDKAKTNSNEGFRPFTPPNSSASNKDASSKDGSTNSTNENKGRSGTNASSESKAPRSSASKPASQHKSPPPRRSAQKEERHKGR